MIGTPMIHDLVREGRATPRQGAELIELRRNLAVRRQDQLRKRMPIYGRAFVVLGVLFLALLGIRRNQA